MTRPRLLIWIKRYWRSLTCFILAAITVLSLSPLQELPSVPGSDKTHHLVAYGTLMLPIALKKPRHFWLITVGIIVWSGAIELIQPYVNRYGEWRDLLANITGLFCGWLITQVVKSVFVNLDEEED